MTGEQWLPVVGQEGRYEVSDRGRVRSLDHTDSKGRLRKGRVLKLRLLPTGRPRVSLARRDRVVDAYPYRLMLEAFVGPCPPGMEALHWDDDSSNNNLANLRWGTRAENMRDMSRNDRGNAGLTNCPKGHPYDENNTYVYPGPRKHRGCRECGRQHSRDKRLRAREGKAA